MKTTFNITLDADTLALAVTQLNNDELGRLMRALEACARCEDGEQYLNTSGLRIAFALLSPSVVRSAKRFATLRANGAKGGRPRKRPVDPVETQNIASSPVGTVVEGCPVTRNPGSPVPATSGSTLVSTKKSKKEDLPPTPPIEEKIKKNNNIITPSHSACAGEEEGGHSPVPVTHVVPELEELQRQMLHEQPWLEQLCMTRRIRAEDMALYIADYIKFLRERDLRETLPHAKAHFVNQLPYIIKIYKSHQDNHENSQKFIADPVARRQSERESRRQAVCRAIAGLAAQGQQPACHPF